MPRRKSDHEFKDLQLVTERLSASLHYYQSHEWLDAQKAVPCADCAGTFHPCQMDFDHRPGEDKKFTVSSGSFRSRASVIAEIAKCDIVCSNCHRLRTFNRTRAGQRRVGRPRKS